MSADPQLLSPSDRPHGVAILISGFSAVAPELRAPIARYPPCEAGISQRRHGAAGGEEALRPRARASGGRSHRSNTESEPLRYDPT